MGSVRTCVRKPSKQRLPFEAGCWRCGDSRRSLTSGDPYAARLSASRGRAARRILVLIGECAGYKRLIGQRKHLQHRSQGYFMADANTTGLRNWRSTHAYGG